MAISTMTCRKCGKTSERRDFTKAALVKGSIGLCKSCDALAQKLYRDKNRDAVNERCRRYVDRDPSRWRRYNIKALYGITLEDWENMFMAQGKCCAICKTTVPGGRGWGTDHCHTSGCVRGILCHSCNSMLGYSKDNINTLEAGIAYLDAFNKTREKMHGGKKF